MHEDNLTVTAPTIMWIKVWNLVSSFKFINVTKGTKFISFVYFLENKLYPIEYFLKMF